MKKLTATQLDKYDINQKIINTLADLESRTILFSIKQKLKPLLVEKYDIDQKIFNELVHLESRHILFSIIKEPKTILDISKEMKIPLSSAYKQIQSLKECSLITEKKDYRIRTHCNILSKFNQRC
jgi:hypothetical protein